MRPLPLALVTLAAFPLAAGTPQRGMPPLTAQTQRSGGPVEPARATLRFIHADLSFEVTPRTRRLDGTAVLRFTAGTPIDALVLDLDRNLAVSGIAVDDAPLPRGAWRNPDGRLAITLPRAIAAGTTFTVRIAYGGTPHVARNAPWDDGIVWATTPDGRPWIATTSEGYGCDLLWPCLDFPTGEPASVDLHIVAPKGLAAPANGVLIRTEQLPDGRTRWHWRARQPNTYAIALNIGPYERMAGVYRSRFGNAIPMEYWHLPGRDAEARALFDEFAPTLDFLERTIGPYPFGDEKLGVVETPHKGMEHQTINAYGNDYAKAPEGFDWLFQHELAHEWFGNQATAADWDDYWLHEGFANYMQPLYGRWREGEARYAVMMEQQRNAILNRVPLVSGRSRTEEEVYEAANGGPGTDIYYKGAWVLHTLRWLIGDAAFADAARLLVYGRTDPRPGNFRPRYVRTADFVAAAERTGGRPLGWFFDAYLRRAALPDLVTTRNGDRLTLEWRAGGAFPMPVEIAVDGAVRRIDLSAGRAIVPVAAGAHVVVDPMARILRRSPAIERMQAWQARRAGPAVTRSGGP